MVGGIVAAIIVIVAHKRRYLSASGAATALVFGVICSAAAWGWAALLIAFFVSGTLFSHYKEDRKAVRMAAVVAKGGNRDAWQVFANGGVLCASAAASLASSSPVWMCIGAGAIGASAADTWATEIGVLSNHEPRSILTRRVVAPGQSGGITALGTFAGILGGAAMAAVAFGAGWGTSAVAAAILGGVGGCTLDSILGATLQVGRWCDRCNTSTERNVHDCGSATSVAAGLPWMDNDFVNALSSAFGGFLGIIVYLVNRS